MKLLCAGLSLAWHRVAGLQAQIQAVRALASAYRSQVKEERGALCQ